MAFSAEDIMEDERIRNSPVSIQGPWGRATVRPVDTPGTIQPQQQQQQFVQTTEQNPPPRAGGAENSPGAGQGAFPMGDIETPNVQIAPYVGPEDIDLGQELPEAPKPGIPEGQDLWAEPPPAVPMSEANERFENLRDEYYEQTMEPVRADLARRGVSASSMMARAASEAGSQATRNIWGQLQKLNQQRLNRWQATQNQALQRWAARESQFRSQLDRWQRGRQAREQEAQQRRQWARRSYQIPRQQYRWQVSTMLDALTTPYQQIPYESRWPQQTRGGF